MATIAASHGGFAEILSASAYRHVWFGSLTTSLAYVLQSVAGSWLMLDLTGSTVWVGLMVAAPVAPIPFIGLLAGAIADRVDRGRVMVAAASVTSAGTIMMAAAVLSGRHSPAMLLALAVVTGIGLTLWDPSMSASIPDLVPRRLVSQAVTLTAGSNAAVWSSGSAVGGLIIAIFGPDVALAVSASGYVATLIAVATIRHHGARVTDRSPLSAAMLAGLRHIWHGSRYRTILATVALFATTATSLHTLMPSLVADSLYGGSAAYGLMLGAFGAGAVFGLATRQRGSTLLKDATVPFAILAFGASGLVLGSVRSIVVAPLFMLTAGAFWTWVLATLSAMMQILAPQQIRARAMSIYILCLFGPLAGGSVIAGVIGDLVGPSRALSGYSVVIGVLGLWTRTRYRNLRYTA